jgi:site-specific recombinase XerD
MNLEEPHSADPTSSDPNLSQKSDSVLSLLPLAADHLRLPASLTGENGRNRAAAGKAQIAADDDVHAIQAWLARFVDRKTTFENYRKEAERLLLWSTLQLGEPVSSLTHEDFLRFREFIADPQPPERWVSGGGRKFPRTDPRWRPFYGPLSPASQRQTMIILNVMFNWLVEAGYLSGNPLALSRKRGRRLKPRIVRYLDPGLWQAVKAYIKEMPQSDSRQRKHSLRSRWLVTLLYLGGIRISEVSENTMGSFFSRRSRDGKEQWWLQILGKGEQTRLIPATEEMMEELAAYRCAYGLSRYPSPEEETPLVLPLGKSRSPLSRAALHVIVKEVFAGAAQRLRLQGEEDAARANELEKASAHWFRHTAASSMADEGIDLRMVRDNLGHASLTTTSLYLHDEDDRRYAETEEKHRINW